MEDKKIWFKRKKYGWGWRPVTWQGWVVILMWILVVISLSSKMDHEGLKNIFFILVMTGLLVYVCYSKGETPKWQWGEKNEIKKD